MLYIGIVGALGSMGKMLVEKISEETESYRLVFKVDSGYKHDDCRLQEYRELARALATNRVHLVLDFTHPNSALENAKLYRDFRVAALIGTTGWTEEKLRELENYKADYVTSRPEQPIVIIPNFSLTTIKMIEDSLDIIKSLGKTVSKIEINEKHHIAKADISGTAIQWAKTLNKALGNENPQIKEIDKLHLRVGDIVVNAERIDCQGYAENGITIDYQGGSISLKDTARNRYVFWPGIQMAMNWTWLLSTKNNCKLINFNVMPQIIKALF